MGKRGDKGQQLIGPAVSEQCSVCVAAARSPQCAADFYGCSWPNRSIALKGPQATPYTPERQPRPAGLRDLPNWAHARNARRLPPVLCQLQAGGSVAGEARPRHRLGDGRGRFIHPPPPRFRPHHRERATPTRSTSVSFGPHRQLCTGAVVWLCANGIVVRGWFKCLSNSGGAGERFEADSNIASAVFAQDRSTLRVASLNVTHRSIDLALVGMNRDAAHDSPCVKPLGPAGVWCGTVGCPAEGGTACARRRWFRSGSECAPRMRSVGGGSGPLSFVLNTQSARTRLPFQSHSFARNAVRFLLFTKFWCCFQQIQLKIV